MSIKKSGKPANQQARWIEVTVRKPFIPFKRKPGAMSADGPTGFVRVFADISVVFRDHNTDRWTDWSVTMHKYMGGFRFMFETFGKYNPNESWTEEQYLDKMRKVFGRTGFLLIRAKLEELKVRYFTPRPRKESD